eukprot:Rhum_TRINITY_DN20819_c0_g1::Rhum_TRINITY_DN20819_c0_g1_i1::g.172295::m.172295
MPLIGTDYQNFFGPANPLWYAILAKVYILPQYANYKKDPARFGPPKLHLPKYALGGLLFLSWASIFSKREHGLGKIAPCFAGAPLGDNDPLHAEHSALLRIEKGEWPTIR